MDEENDIEQTSKDDFESLPLINDSSHQQQRYFTLSPTLSVWTITTIILLIILLTTPSSLNEHENRHKSSLSRDRNYMTLDHDADGYWEDFLDDNMGFIQTESGSGLITMFHQLHCLASLRHALQQSQAGEAIGVDWRDNLHWPHCMDYLRSVCSRLCCTPADY
ncbi:hypothetical protein G647_08089 [Cladophialophora carrionii CBS 160.54]|uniref:Uncharacterized protein n=1 Tax=Cladophialophora carrionii CBS 160.54 TaxID=1279043 RepID=V9D6X8_9EURO|nr:uncharacterized protein G647_08089 [Cladophialophora carrionii CBS 160.54]ETI21742.1 hypothetical protein G647_08089 [Cladophialophora carrionii CBS 160.54]